jgi:hypothetical protein
MVPGARTSETFAAAPVPIDDAIISRIVAGHKRLADSVSRVSGVIVHSRGVITPADADAFSTKDLGTLSRVRFCVSGESIRGEYLPATTSVAIHSPQPAADLEEVLVEAGGVGFRYLPVSTTGSPHATLFRYKDPRVPELDLRLKSDVWVPLSSLTAMGIRPILDLLQRPGVSLKQQAVDGVDDALVISGFEKSGQAETSTFTIILNPARDYALEQYETTSEAAGVTTRFAGRIRRVDRKGESFIPRELAVGVLTTSKGTIQEASSYREVAAIDFESTPSDTVDSFSLDGFAKLGRELTVVDVNSRDDMRVGQTIGPVPTTSNGLPTADEFLRQAGGQTRTFYLLLVNGILLICLGLALGYGRWRRRKGD